MIEATFRDSPIGKISPKTEVSAKPHEPVPAQLLVVDSPNIDSQAKAERELGRRPGQRLPGKGLQMIFRTRPKPG